jgi:hypothetical protein
MTTDEPGCGHCRFLIFLPHNRNWWTAGLNLEIEAAAEVVKQGKYDLAWIGEFNGTLKGIESGRTAKMYKYFVSR